MYSAKEVPNLLANKEKLSFYNSLDVWRVLGDCGIAGMAGMRAINIKSHKNCPNFFDFPEN